MVEYTPGLNHVFYALSDPIRRDIMQCVAQKEYSVGELAAFHDVTFAAISKHIMVLEAAGIIYKRREGRKQIISLVPSSLKSAGEYIERLS